MSEPETPLPATSGRSQAAAPTTSAADARRKALLVALGRNVRTLRSERGLSQQVLAQRAGLSPRFVAQLEAGRGNISVAKLDELARALAVPLSALVQAMPEAGAAAEAEGALRREVVALVERSPESLLRAVRALLDGGLQAAEEAAPTAVIALLGLRGAGKSTLGPLLAGALGRPFLELDELIQEQSGLALSELFELHGERYYRQVEREALRHLLEQGRPAVLAVSGGAVTDPETFALLRMRTLAVWLTASPEQHMERVLSQGDRRPMADRPDAMAELRALLRARTPYYEQARLVVDTSGTDPRACLGGLLADLERLGVRTDG